ncbi:Replication factor C subunit 1 [Armadillidium vulgare]|nr:Replication factor C subunit 1 [Armadillidium vulgare]
MCVCGCVVCKKILFQDIRKYFSPVNGKKKVGEVNEKKGNDLKKKRRKHIIESDDEDPLPRVEKEDSLKLKRKKLIDLDDEDPLPQKSKVLASDSEDEIFELKFKLKVDAKKNSSSQCKSSKPPKPKPIPKPSPPKLKPATVTDFFGSNPVSHSRNQSSKRKAADLSSLQSVESFEKTLQQLDETQHTKKFKKEDKSNCNGDVSPKKESCQNSKKGSLASKLSDKMKEKERKSIKEEKRNHSLKAEKSPDLKSFKRETSAKKIELKEETKKPASVTVEVKIEKRVTPTKKKIPHEVETNKKVTPTQKNFSLEVETNKKVTPTQNKCNDSPHVKEEKTKAETTPDVTEMKKQRSIAFKNFMQRSGPKNPGSKPLPEGERNCLCGMTFVITGVLESIDREEASDLIKKYGGRVTTSVSKNTTYLIIGEDPGANNGKKENKSKLSQFERQKKETSSNSLSFFDTESSSDSTLKSPASSTKSLPTWPSPSSTKSSPSSTRSSSQSAASLSSQDLELRSSENLMFVDRYRPVSLKNIIGKTTTAHLVAKEVDFDVVELNASDTRSKKALSEEVSQLLTNKSLAGYASERSGSDATSRNRVLLMDEVDGMAGNEDRGGVQELIALIKGSKIPIICMCNDRNHPKIRSLANYCFDLRFHKPRVEQIRGPWDVCMKVFSESAHKGMSIHDKVSLFFHDYSIGPLFIQENYLKVSPHCARGNRNKLLEQVAKTAEVLADSDIIDKAIRTQSAWSLLPTQALYSSVCPGQYMEGHLSAQVEFPKWLGNNSKKNKFDRLSQELLTHMRLRISASKQDIVTDYSSRLRDAVVSPLVTKGSEGVAEAVNVMLSNDLLREDLDSLLELSLWPGTKDKMTSVESKVKAAFTRTLNKEAHMTPFSTLSIAKKSSRVTQEDLELLDEGEEEEEEEEDDDDITKGGMIKVGKHSEKKASTSKGSEPSSKGRRQRKRKKISRKFLRTLLNSVKSLKFIRTLQTGNHS